MLIFIANCLWAFQVHFDCYLLHDGARNKMLEIDGFARESGKCRSNKCCMLFVAPAQRDSIEFHSDVETVFALIVARNSHRSLSTNSSDLTCCWRDNHFPLLSYFICSTLPKPFYWIIKFNKLCNGNETLHITFAKSIWKPFSIHTSVGKNLLRRFIACNFLLIAIASGRRS